MNSRFLYIFLVGSVFFTSLAWGNEILRFPYKKGVIHISPTPLKDVEAEAYVLFHPVPSLPPTPASLSIQTFFKDFSYWFAVVENLQQTLRTERNNRISNFGWLPFNKTRDRGVYPLFFDERFPWSEKLFRRRIQDFLYRVSLKRHPRIALDLRQVQVPLDAVSEESAIAIVLEEIIRTLGGDPRLESESSTEFYLVVGKNNDLASEIRDLLIEASTKKNHNALVERVRGVFEKHPNFRGREFARAFFRNFAPRRQVSLDHLYYSYSSILNPDIWLPIGTIDVVFDRDRPKLKGYVEGGDPISLLQEETLLIVEVPTSDPERELSRFEILSGKTVFVSKPANEDQFIQIETAKGRRTIPWKWVKDARIFNPGWKKSEYKPHRTPERQGIRLLEKFDVSKFTKLTHNVGNSFIKLVTLSEYEIFQQANFVFLPRDGRLNHGSDDPVLQSMASTGFGNSIFEYYNELVRTSGRDRLGEKILSGGSAALSWDSTFKDIHFVHTILPSIDPENEREQMVTALSNAFSLLTRDRETDKAPVFKFDHPKLLISPFFFLGPTSTLATEAGIALLVDTLDLSLRNSPIPMEIWVPLGPNSELIPIFERVLQNPNSRLKAMSQPPLFASPNDFFKDHVIAKPELDLERISLSHGALARYEYELRKSYIRFARELGHDWSMLRDAKGAHLQGKTRYTHLVHNLRGLFSKEIVVIGGRKLDPIEPFVRSGRGVLQSMELKDVNGKPKWLIRLQLKPEHNPKTSKPTERFLEILLEDIEFAFAKSQDLIEGRKIARENLSTGAPLIAEMQEHTRFDFEKQLREIDLLGSEKDRDTRLLFLLNQTYKAFQMDALPEGTTGWRIFPNTSVESGWILVPSTVTDTAYGFSYSKKGSEISIQAFHPLAPKAVFAFTQESTKMIVDQSKSTPSLFPELLIQTILGKVRVTNHPAFLEVSLPNENSLFFYSPVESMKEGIRYLRKETHVFETLDWYEEYVRSLAHYAGTYFLNPTLATNWRSLFHQNLSSVYEVIGIYRDKIPSHFDQTLLQSLKSSDQLETNLDARVVLYETLMGIHPHIPNEDHRAIVQIHSCLTILREWIYQGISDPRLSKGDVMKEGGKNFLRIAIPSFEDPPFDPRFIRFSEAKKSKALQRSYYRLPRGR